MITNKTMVNSPLRKVKAKVELYNGSTLVNTYSHTDDLIKVDIDRAGAESKFFGFGICQKAAIQLLDKNREKTITKNNSCKVYFTTDEEYICNAPIFYVNEAKRDENTNQIDIVAYDAIYTAGEHKVKELGLVSYTLTQFAEACAKLLGLSGVELPAINTYYESGANFSGDETIRAGLDAVAEATQSIYYITCENVLRFKRLSAGDPDLTITKRDYFSLEDKAERKLTNIISTTELGNNVAAGLKGTASGRAIRFDDILPEARQINVQSTATVYAVGKNILPVLEKGTQLSANGTTFEVVDNGGIAVNGTPTDMAIFNIVSMKPITTTGKITLSLSGEYSNIIPDMKLLDSDGISLVQIQNNATIDLDLYPTATQWVVAIKRGQNNIETSGTVYVQLELGDKRTDYTAPIAPESYAPEAGSAVSAIFPTTTLYTTEDVVINVEYYKKNEADATQYVRDNPFWDMREDIASLVDDALAAVNGLTITPFTCSWRGNYLLEVGDKIAIEGKDGSTIVSYVLNDSIHYNGGLSQETSWSYTDSTNETASNPSTLGEVIKLTYANVDKANSRIELVASESADNASAISMLQVNTGEISASVSRIEDEAATGIDNIKQELDVLASSVSARLTAEEVQIEIEKELANGVDKVTTTTGFTFDDEGLTISKSGAEMTTQITEDGMTVYRDDTAVLTANNVGVNAANLHATTYLIIGTNSRFEDYTKNYEKRTGCFWIGG